MYFFILSSRYYIRLPAGHCISIIVHLTTPPPPPKYSKYSHAVFASPCGSKIRVWGTCVAGCHKWCEGRPLDFPSVVHHLVHAPHPASLLSFNTSSSVLHSLFTVLRDPSRAWDMVEAYGGRVVSGVVVVVRVRQFECGAVVVVLAGCH